jgi:Cu2+-containing amine oxidase
MSTTVDTTTHSLDPLKPEEIVGAVARMRELGLLGESFRVHGVEVIELEDKHSVLSSHGGPAKRQLRLIVVDRATGGASEVVVAGDTRELAVVPILEGSLLITLEKFERRGGALQSGLRATSRR